MVGYSFRMSPNSLRIFVYINNIHNNNNNEIKPTRRPNTRTSHVQFTSFTNINYAGSV